ncbi:type IV pilin N-terminal domain-containing protein [Halorubrum sp. CBA1229]|uniref:type IV pilin n=1 Tax=Halorubrum sp. CBA1229 TaxID=1853699 RepID=UPI000F3AACF3|nr:type IV pilin N-terminal domain-containing protein [Halorubrum sp. CBA1229]QKY18276.1 type IV pilin N-terminal domain-containing protein [Halorubrum sp. CBA1229]
MKPSNLFNSDNRAVSPVIGVILMVAITVILAAVIGTFVLGLGDSLGDSQPTAQLDVNVENDTTTAGQYNLEIEHSGGDRIDSQSLNIIITDSDGDEANSSGEFGDALTVGDIQTGTFGVTDDSTATEDLRIRIIHTPSDSVLLDRTIEVDDISTISGGDITF